MLGTPGLRAPSSLGSWTGIMKQRKDPTTSERAAWVVLVTSDTTTTGRFPTLEAPTTTPTCSKLGSGK